VGQSTQVNPAEEALNPLLHAAGVPTSIQLLYALATELDQLGNQIPDQPYDIAKIDWAHPPQTLLWAFQLLAVGVLSMWGGALSPLVKRVQYKRSELTIGWNSGISDGITFGKSDAGFTHFLKTLQKHIWNKSVSKTMSPLLIYEFLQLIAQHSEVLTRAQQWIDLLLAGDLTVLQNQAHRIELIFTIISALPVEQMNHLFLHLYQFFPADLTIKSPEGNQINVTALFGSPSQDFRFLIEKSRLFLYLHTSAERPIIQIITQTKTSDYLIDILKKEGQLAKIKTQIEGVRDRQIFTRLRVYYALSEVLNRIAGSR
jgi:hypothetical protein